ncbi:hypothetical protein LEP1GSC087_1644 [Leptospira interrogans serovar Bataviae str. L1111]|nr:hypothetical protein LEP1GSC087_1644 [Leptospira interrogans serovar Bataviae str. L1111]
MNPGDLATIYQSLKKTDKEDSLKIARLIQRHPIEELPTVPIQMMKRKTIADFVRNMRIGQNN